MKTSITTFCLLFLFFIDPANAQDKSWTTITTADGLADNFVHSIIEDKEGNLWFGTDKRGVSCYDGFDWTTFTKKDGLASNSVTTIFVDSKGVLWFGSQEGGGISCYDGKIWKTYTTADGLAHNSIGAIMEDSYGVMWFGTAGGVSLYDGKEWKTLTVKDGLVDNVIRTIIEDRKGEMWFGTTEGVSRYDRKEWRTYTTADGLADNEVFTICEDSRGNIWFGTTEGVSCYDRKEWKTYNTSDGLMDNLVYKIFEDSKGNIWFGTVIGVCRYDGKVWTSYINFNLAGLYVSAIVEDSQGAMWFGTMGGVNRYIPEEWTTYTTADGLAGNGVYKILKDSQGAMWFGTQIYSLDLIYSEGVTRYDGKEWKTFTPPNGLDLIDSYDFYEDSKGLMWFISNITMGGPHGKGVSCYDGVGWTTFTTSDGLTSDTVNAIMEDSHGNMWFGTVGGVSRYDGKEWKTFTTADGLAGDYVYTVMEDFQGMIWIETNVAISRYDGKEWHTFTIADGLADGYVSKVVKDNQGMIWVETIDAMNRQAVSRYDGKEWHTYKFSEYYNDIMKDNIGMIWIITDSDIRRYDGKEWHTFTIGDGLVSNWVNEIVEDRQGNIWFATPFGISVYDGKVWKTFGTADGAGDDVRHIFVDSKGIVWITGDFAGVCRYDGFVWATYLANDNYIDAILEDNHGVIWFGTSNGVSCYKVELFPPNTKIINGSVKGELTGVSVSFFEFKGIDYYTKANDLKFSFAIVDSTKIPSEYEWSPFLHQTSILTPSLSNGTYTFFVRAMNTNGYIDKTPDKRTFTVDLTPPTVAISSPSNNDIVHGEVNIVGLACDNSDIPDFKNYTLEYGKGSDENKVSDWHPIVEDKNQPVVNGILGVWDTKDLFGTYILRLRAVDGLDHRSKYVTTVHVVVALYEVDRSDGGHVNDVSGKVELYIPPNGMPENKQIIITPVAGDEITVSADQHLELAGSVYDIEPLNLELQKTATLSLLQDSSKVSPGKRLSIFNWSDINKCWIKIGGTFDTHTGRITSAINKLGRFAVMNDLSEDLGSLSITNLDCQPRAFSPKGGGFDNKTSITFSLGKNLNATVKIYDSSGRLQKKVIHGEHMNQGSNAVVWDGRDNDGNVVVSGLYIVTVEVGSKIAKMTVGVINK